MLKKIFALTLFLFLSACGYEAIHSKKNSINYDFTISKLTFIGNRDINLKIKEKLNNYTLTKKDKSFQLRVSSTNEKLVLAKDISGDPTSFKSTIIITVQVFIEGSLKNDLQITENFNYNNNSNKFNLKRYEKEIINNLAETVADKLIFKLSNIQ
jgi:outer membrane lipopolysaccharide assembly protein LptE/RlpB